MLNAYRARREARLCTRAEWTGGRLVYVCENATTTALCDLCKERQRAANAERRRREDARKLGELFPGMKGTR